MDGINTPDLSAASADSASAPSDAVASAATNEAVSAEQNLPNQPDVAIGESSAPSLEFPDDAALVALPANERQSNWQQLRQAYTTAKQQAEAFQAFQPHLPVIEQAGGLDRVLQQAELGGLLFSQVEDPQTGQLEFSTQPFVDRLANESPDTLRDLVWLGIHGGNPANPQETIAHAFIRDYVGLSTDPKVLEFYRQFQSQQDVTQFLAQSGQITAEELAEVPEQFHDAYKSLTPAQREEYALFGNDAVKQEFLQDKSDALQARHFMAAQQQVAEQQRQEAAKVFEQRVEARGRELGESTVNTLLESVRAKLQTEATFSGDASVNGALHNEAIQYATQKTLEDPALAADNQRAEWFYVLSARAELTGDKFKAAEYKVQADSLARKLEGRFRNAVNERVAFWSQAFGVSRQATQQLIQQARPRPELGANGVQAASAPKSPPAKQNGFGFTSEQVEQYAAQVRARMMGG